MPTNRFRPLIDDFIDIKSQLSADTNKSYEILQQRDRRIGMQHADLKSDPVRQVRAWIDSVQQGSGNAPSANLSSIKTAMSSILILTGLVTGASAAMALFYYTGEQPINVINVLAIGVGLQLLLLAVFFMALFSNSVWLKNFLSSFNAGRWAARLAYFIPSLKNPLNTLMDSTQGAIDEHIVKWQTIFWSQQFALAFNIALLLSCLYLVSFSDLAFGWSTTLAFDSHLVKKITDVLSLPWKTFLPAAVPQIELIDATRFYRLKTITLGNQEGGVLNQAQIAGNWWRFLFLCLLVYGFIPRFLTFIYAKFKLTRSINQSILGLPGLHLLLDRMNTPNIATNAETPEVSNDLTQVNSPRQTTALTDRDSFILHWGQPAIESKELSNWLHNLTGTNVLNIETVASNNDDNLSELTSLPEIQNRQVLAILVKAWEPPTLELTDWLAELRTHYGNQVLIALLPYGINSQSGIDVATQADSKTWQDFLRRQNAQHIEFHGAQR